MLLVSSSQITNVLPSLPSACLPGKTEDIEPVEVFFAIFDAARTLREKIVRRILPKTEIPSIEDADILFTLYLAELHHKKQAPPSSKEITPVKLRAQENSIYATPDTEGYYLVKEVRKSLVYKQSGLSRRLSQLAKKPSNSRKNKEPATAMIEIEDIDLEKLSKRTRMDTHGNAKRIKLTHAGREAIEVVHKLYISLAMRMLKDVSVDMWRIQIMVNQHLVTYKEE